MLFSVEFPAAVDAVFVFHTRFFGFRGCGFRFCASDRVKLHFALEAKCYSPGNTVGVKETSRLISRIKHREFGVMVTTSAVNTTAYKEIREDGHPIVIITGRDIANTLIENGISSPAECRRWMDGLLGSSAATQP